MAVEFNGEDIHPRADISVRFTALYELAGRPVLKRLADNANAGIVHADPRRPTYVSAQRLSDWRTGTAVPARFDGLGATIRVLIAAAQARTPTPPIDGLYSVRDWHARWLRARRSAPTDKEDTQASAAGQADAPCPYRGLSAFADTDSSVFYGREHAVANLRAKVVESIGAGGITFLVGASGSGKSSLLRAGLIPALRPDCEATVFTPGRDPIGGFRQAVQAPATAGRRVLIVDQLEELFTQCTDASIRRQFVDLLSDIAAGTSFEGVRVDAVVLAIRADFYEGCLRYNAFAEAFERSQMVLGAMSRDELICAVTGPAAFAGVGLEAGLVDLILRDLGAEGARSNGVGRSNAGALPLLAHALLTTWNARTGVDLTIAAYQSTGGVRGAVASTAEQTWAELTPAQQVAARQIFLQLVQINDDTHDTHDTRRKVDEPRLLVASGDPHAGSVALGALTHARLVTKDRTGVELTHEAIIDAWPRLSEWLSEDRAGTRQRQRVDKDADEWNRVGRDASLLYRGIRLDSAMAAYSNDIRPQRYSVTHDFLEASTRSARRALLWRRGSVITLAMFMVLATVGAIGAASQRNSALNQRNDAQFAEVLAQVARTQNANPSLSAQLALVASAMRPDDETASTMVRAAQSSPLSTPVLGHEGAVYDVAIGSNGIVASASYDKTVRLWDLSDQASPRQVAPPLTGHTSWITSVAFSPDGRTLASGSGDRSVRLWDITDPAHPRALGAPLLGHTAAVYMVAFSPDGHTLASASDDHTTRLWNLDDPLAVTPRSIPLAGHTAAVRSVAFSSDGRTLATGSDDHTAILWNLANIGAPVPWGQPIVGHSNTVHSVAFSPDSRFLATGSDDQSARLWHVDNPAGPLPSGDPMVGHNAAIWSVGFSPSGAELVTASWDGTARVWSLSDPNNPTALGQPLAGSGGGLTTAMFARHGSTVVTGGQDGALRMWALPSTVIPGHTLRMAAPVFDRSGHRMATGSRDGVLNLWDTTDPNQPELDATVRSPDGIGIENIALSPDGLTLASAGLGSGTVQLWDLGSPNGITPQGNPLRLASRYTHELAFAPNSHILATASDDQSIQLWDVEDPGNAVSLGAPLTGTAGWVNDVAFSPDGSLLAAASSDKSIRVWKVTDPTLAKPSASLTGHLGAVNAIAFSPDGGAIASGSDDQSVRLWTIGGTDRDASEKHSVLVGHTSTVRSVAYSRDGHTLASGSDDETVRLWDVADPAAPAELGGSLTSTDTVRWRVLFVPSGDYLAATAEGGTIRIWNLDVGTIKDRICAQTHGILTRDLWQQYLPHLEFAPPCR